MILAEAQSTWSVNIVVRAFLYLAQTWNEYIEATDQNRYGSRKLNLPRPEIYVIFSGNRLERPEYLSSREKEVVSIMMALFDQEKAMEQFGYEKMQEGRINQAKKTASNMLKRGLSLNEVAEILELPVETIRSWN